MTQDQIIKYRASMTEAFDKLCENEEAALNKMLALVARMANDSNIILDLTPIEGACYYD